MSREQLTLAAFDSEKQERWASYPDEIGPYERDSYTQGSNGVDSLLYRADDDPVEVDNDLSNYDRVRVFHQQGTDYGDWAVGTQFPDDPGWTYVTPTLDTVSLGELSEECSYDDVEEAERVLVSYLQNRVDEAGDGDG